MCRKNAIPVSLAFLVGVVTVPQHAAAQWVTFNDETAARLSLSPFVDDATPDNDDEEKDIAVADFDRDGWTDVVIVRKMLFSNPGARQDVLLMNEGGILVDRTAQFAPGFLADLTDARDVLCADLDMDGWDDIVVVTTFDDDPKFYRNRGNDAGGNWLGLVDESSRVADIGAQSTPFKMCGISAGDVNGDTFPDLYWSNYQGGDDLLLINDGNGMFTDETVARLGDLAHSAFGTANQIIDMDNDGDNDIVKNTTLFSAPPFSTGVFILWNDGTGHFSSFSTVSGVSAPYMFMVGNIDNDPDDTNDVYVVQDPQDSIHLTTINGPQNISWQNLSPNPSPRTSGFGGNAYFVDIDNDGDLDASVGAIDVDIANCPNSGNGGPDMALLRNDGTGHLSDPWPSNQDQNFHLASHDVRIFDIDNDGCVDIFMGLCEGWRVLIQTNGNCVVALPGDIDGDGDVDFVDRDLFVAVLLGNDVDPDHVANSDLNGDNNANGVDIGPFVAALLP